jgi:hypothetical protein
VADDGERREEVGAVGVVGEAEEPRRRHLLVTGKTEGYMDASSSAAAAAFIISRSSRMLAGMQDDAMNRSIQPKPHRKISTFFQKRSIRGDSNSVDRIGEAFQSRMEDEWKGRNQGGMPAD